MPQPGHVHDVVVPNHAMSTVVSIERSAHRPRTVRNPAAMHSVMTGRSGMAAVSALIPMEQVSVCDMSVTLNAVPSVGPKS